MFSTAESTKYSTLLDKHASQSSALSRNWANTSLCSTIGWTLAGAAATYMLYRYYTVKTSKTLKPSKSPTKTETPSRTSEEPMTAHAISAKKRAANPGPGDTLTLHFTSGARGTVNIGDMVSQVHGKVHSEMKSNALRGKEHTWRELIGDWREEVKTRNPSMTDHSKIVTALRKELNDQKVLGNYRIETTLNGE